MFYCYILKSVKDNSYYVGQTADYKSRLKKHNAGHCVYTKRKAPWGIVHLEEFETRLEATRRENEIKKQKSKLYIEKLINGG